MIPRLDRDTVARLVDDFGRRWHGYEIRHAERIPRDGPCLLVMYHGFVPFDGWFFVARLYRERGLLVRPLTDRFLVRTPGLRSLVALSGGIAGDPAGARRLLDEGHPLLVSPGGVREALKGRAHHYQVTWGDRTGFAKLAIDAGVPLVPLFGENVESLYRSPGANSWPVQALYEATKLPITPVVGLGLLPLPVKLRTWVGEPLYPQPGESPAALRDRTRDALQALIDAHQGPAPRLPRALWQRLRPGPPA